MVLLWFQVVLGASTLYPCICLQVYLGLVLVFLSDIYIHISLNLHVLVIFIPCEKTKTLFPGVIMVLIIRFKSQISSSLGHLYKNELHVQTTHAADSHLFKKFLTLLSSH